jgi:hypothetical protein
VRKLDAPSGDLSVNAVAADAAGNVIVVGSVETTAHARDWLVAKWSRGGKLLWKRQLDGTAHGQDGAKDVAVAADGSIVVVGTLDNAGTNDDGLIVRYSPRGKVLWKRLVDGAEHSSDALLAVALDKAGYAYAAGYDYATARANDALLIRYGPKGHKMWTRRWGDPVALKHDSFSDVAVRGGYVAVAGITENDPAGWENRGLAAKYATAHGALKWVRPSANPTDPAREAEWGFVGIDSKGRVATAGWAATSAVPGEGEWVTTVYSAAGAAGVVQTMQGDLPTGNYPGALLSTAGGTVYVTGCLAYSATSLDLYTMALSSAGVPKWGSLVGDPVGANDLGHGLAATSKAVYVGAAYYQSLALVKYAR